jgi:hypothetical protein
MLGTHSGKKKSAPEGAQSAEVESCKVLPNDAGITRRRGDRLARLDHGGISRAEAVGDARGKANADDQRREDERHCHHLQVGKAAGGKQRKIVHDTFPKDIPIISRGSPAKGSTGVGGASCVPLAAGKEESRWRGEGPAARLASRGLTGLLNPCVKSGTKLFQPYFMNCFNCASPLRRSSDARLRISQDRLRGGLNVFAS